VLTEYIEEALRRAHYDIMDEEDSYYGEVSELKGVWASGRTLEECRKNLKEVIEGWILFRTKKGMSMPKLGEYGIREIEETIL